MSSNRTSLLNSVNMTTDENLYNGTLFPSNFVNNDTLFNVSIVTEETIIDTQDQGLISALRHINYVLQVLVLIFGLMGNTLTICVMRSPLFTKMTSKFYLIALAISDSILLITQPFNKLFVRELFGKDVRALSVYSCKAFFVLFRTSKMTSSWFVVSLCFERFFAVWMPFQIKQICHRRLALTVLFMIYTLIGSFNIFWSRNSNVDGEHICHPDVYDVNKPEEVTSYKTMLVIGSCLYTLIPIAILSVFSPAIIFKICYHHMKRKEIVKSPSLRKQNEAQKSTIMLLGIMIAYIFLTLPITVLHNVTFYAGTNAFGRNNTSILVFREVAQILEMINYSVNFLLYVLTSRQFRRVLGESIFRLNFCKQCKDNSRQGTLETGQQLNRISTRRAQIISTTSSSQHTGNFVES